MSRKLHSSFCRLQSFSSTIIASDEVFLHVLQKYLNLYLHLFLRTIFLNTCSQYVYNIVGHKWQVKKYNTGCTFIVVVVTLRQVD